MPTNSLSPIAVVEYSKGYIHNLIRYLTGWDQRSEVSDKVQLNYLCGYLEIDHISAKTTVLETEYVDRHYIEDYSEYYARCFPSHPRKCSRLHFFSNKFDEPAFINALQSNDSEFTENLSRHYLGYVVIRPIPHTFLAKVCLIPYGYLAENIFCKLITTPNKVSLFGIPLVVNAAPFLEQDKVVSVCATSALWMFFNSSNHKTNGDLPSPSAITKSATGIAFDGARTFPSSGLTPTQVARSLKHFGFEPMIFNVTSDYLDFREILFGHIKYNIPVLIAGSIYKKNNDDAVEYVGDHLVCAVGYNLINKLQATTESLYLISHNIDKIYVHDDRYGPYLRISLQPIYFEFKPKDGDINQLEGLELSINSSTNTTEYFVPDVVITGVYHKIRLTYFDIRKMCESFYYYLQESKERLDIGVSSNKYSMAETAHSKKIIGWINTFLKAKFEIAITSNTDIKEEILRNNDFVTFNGAVEKSSCLLKSMPKYIWRCRIQTDEVDSNASRYIADILFDATEVAQGQVLVGYITYSREAEKMWKYVERSICNNSWATFPFSSEIKMGVSGFLKFFQKNKNQLYLNTLYGFPGLPRRDLKPGEADLHNNLLVRNDIQTIRAGNTSFVKKLPKNKKHIWVVNEYGDLVVGEDIEDKINNEDNQGHPTLVDGRPARLGGELIYSVTDKCWFANLRSRTYSSHLPLGARMRFLYLSNVVKNNLNCSLVKISPDEIPLLKNTLTE